jgi:hypothetical protein
LGEETAISPRPRHQSRGGKFGAALAAFVVLAGVLSACGDKPRQDANEPDADFPVAVNVAKFATEQRLAETSNLELDIENIGDQQIPDLAVTIYTGDTKGGGSFSEPC